MRVVFLGDRETTFGAVSFEAASNGMVFFRNAEGEVVGAAPQNTILYVVRT